MLRALLAFSTFLSIAGPTSASPRVPSSAPAEPLPAEFVDVSSNRGIGPYQNEYGLGSGLAASDYDNDGDVDFFVPQGANRADRLYRNRGDGTFEDVAGAVGLGSMEVTRVALWLDYDADGDLDLFTVNDDPLAVRTFTLYRQNTPYSFEDVTVQAGLVKAPASRGGVHQWGAVCAGDINNDGYLDIYTSEWFGPSHLFLNDGRGQFQDISNLCGMPIEYDLDGEWITYTRHGSVMYDFNRDGWTDIYTAVDFSPNELWINRRNGQFEDVAVQAGLGNWMNDMGIALGDYDNDGDMDIYCTNITADSKHNVLQRNDSVEDEVRFMEVARSFHVDSAYFAWGTTFLDVENDGDLDLAVTNGYLQREWANDPSVFFLNVAAGTQPFLNVSNAIGFNDTLYGSALLAADFDRDGDLDLLQACLRNNYGRGALRLLDNQATGNGARGNYLVVRPRSKRTNRFAIGAVVRVTADGLNLMRPITAGISYMSQEPAEAFFGLGSATMASQVTVEWPDGDITTLHDVPANQVLDVIQLPKPPVVPIPSTLQLALRNPSDGELRLRFNLPAASSARIELMDAGGRRLGLWELAALDAGAHTMNLRPGTALSAGIYIVRLVQGGDVRTAKVAIVP